MQKINSRSWYVTIATIQIFCTGILGGCGGGGVESTNPPVVTSEITQADVQVAQDVAAQAEALASALQQYVDTQLSLSTAGNAISSTLGTALTNSTVEWYDLMSHIANGETVSVEFPLPKNGGEIANVPISPEAAALWGATVNQFLNNSGATNGGLTKSIVDGTLDAGDIAQLCVGIDALSQALAFAGNYLATACVATAANVSIPGIDEAIACGAFALNGKVSSSTLIGKGICQLYPLHPLYLKVYFEKPCLKQISEIQPTADQTTVEVVGGFHNELNPDTNWKDLFTTLISTLVSEWSLANQAFASLYKDYFTAKMTELVVAAGQQFGGFDFGAKIAMGPVEYPVHPKYVQWSISSPIVSINATTVSSNTARGIATTKAALVHWPISTPAQVSSLDIPLVVSAPPNFLGSESLSVVNCKEYTKFTDWVQFSFTDPDGDVVGIAIDAVKDFYKDTSTSGIRTFIQGTQQGQVTTGTVAFVLEQPDPGSEEIGIGIRDVCGNTTVGKFHLSWSAPPKWDKVDHEWVFSDGTENPDSCFFPTNIGSYGDYIGDHTAAESLPACVSLWNSVEMAAQACFTALIAGQSHEVVLKSRSVWHDAVSAYNTHTGKLPSGKLGKCTNTALDPFGMDVPTYFSWPYFQPYFEMTSGFYSMTATEWNASSALASAIRDDGTLHDNSTVEDDHKPWPQLVKECEALHGNLPTPTCYQWGL